SLVPALTAKLPSKSNHRNLLGGFGHKLLNGYATSLNWSLNRAWLVLIASLIAAGGAYALYSQLQNELMPAEDRGTVRIFARGPDGVGLNFMDRQAREMEEILLPYVDGGAVDS